MAAQPRFETVLRSTSQVLDWRASAQQPPRPDDGFRMMRGVLIGMAICLPFWALVAWLAIRAAGR